jgi:hypothetical protein
MDDCQTITGTLPFYGTPPKKGVGKCTWCRCLFKIDAVVACTRRRGTTHQWTSSQRHPTSPGTCHPRFRPPLGVTRPRRPVPAARRAGPLAAPRRGGAALACPMAPQHDGLPPPEHAAPARTTRTPSTSFTNGGRAPNVVPGFCRVYYYARQNDMKDPG